MKINLKLAFLATCSVFTVFVTNSSFKPATASTLAPLTCKETFLPVALEPGQEAKYQIYGELCARGSFENKTVQVLVSGLTYSSSYWNPDYQPERYSYVESITQAGYATFNYDRIGIGKSSRPPGDQVKIPTSAFVLSQINQALRSGAIEGKSFEKIINFGYASGAVAPLAVASQFGGVDGIILAGYLRNTNQDFLTQFGQSVYPAQDDPILKSQNLPSGYLTTLPGTRGSLFYNVANTDPKVLEIDEATKQTFTTGEGSSLVDAIFSDIYQGVKVPTFLVIGSKDQVFCTGNVCDSSENVAQFMSPFFSKAAQLQTFVVPNGGHALNAELSTPIYFSAIRQWSDRFVGASTKTVPENVNAQLLVLVTLGLLGRLKLKRTKSRHF